MEREVNSVEIRLGSVRSFSELFDLINSADLGVAYQDAYEAAAELAKNAVAAKNKAELNLQNFESEFRGKHAGISAEFAAALKRCVENYNPPANIPDEPLW